MPSHSTFLKSLLFSAKPLAASDYAEKLYDILDRWRYRPQKFNDVEPLRNAWDNREKFIQQCDYNSKEPFGMIIVKWATPSFYLHVTHRRGPRAKCHSLSIYGGGPKAFGGPAAPLLLELADQLFEALGFDYGFACLDDEYHDANIYRNVTLDDGIIQSKVVVGMEWPDCIPGLYWCNYFGDVYFKQGFGKQIAALPNTTHLTNGIRLLRSDSAMDWDSDSERQKTRDLMQILGKDWFFTKDTDMPPKCLLTDKSAFAAPRL